MREPKLEMSCQLPTIDNLIEQSPFFRSNPSRGTLHRAAELLIVSNSLARHTIHPNHAARESQHCPYVRNHEERTTVSQRPERGSLMHLRTHAPCIEGELKASQNTAGKLVTESSPLVLVLASSMDPGNVTRRLLGESLGQRNQAH